MDINKNLHLVDAFAKGGSAHWLTASERVLGDCDLR